MLKTAHPPPSSVQFEAEEESRDVARASASVELDPSAEAVVDGARGADPEAIREPEAVVDSARSDGPGTRLYSWVG